MGALEMARHFYKKGDYRKAAGLFHQAYGFDPLPDFLFNAARAEQRAFMFDESERDFHIFLGLKGTNPTAVRRAKTHLKEVKEARKHIAAVSQRQAEEARRALAAKAEAAQAEAAKADAERARKDEEAARAAAEAARAAEGANGAQPGPATKPDAVAAPGIGAEGSATASGWQGPAGWGALGLGAVSLVGGAALWAMAASDQSELEASVADEHTDEWIYSISFADYEKRRLDNSSNRRLGVIGLSAGAALVGAGVWLLVTQQKGETAWRLQATPGHVKVALRF